MNFYEYLGVKPNASHDEIKHAFRQLAKSTHPDYNRKDNAFWDMVELNLIRDTLLTPSKRAKYDIALQSGQPFEDTPSAQQQTQPPEKTKSSGVIHKVRSLFIYHCIKCGVEMRSTWKGYCMLHYLEATGQLDSEDHIFTYGGVSYQWVDPSGRYGREDHTHGHHSHSHPHTPVTAHPVQIALYLTIIFVILGFILYYLKVASAF
jgi:hypothetical protein